ncbi:MAG: hypothetical protein ACRC1M_05320 [Methanobacteriaceae archaeon]
MWNSIIEGCSFINNSANANRMSTNVNIDSQTASGGALVCGNSVVIVSYSIFINNSANVKVLNTITQGLNNIHIGNNSVNLNLNWWDDININGVSGNYTCNNWFIPSIKYNGEFYAYSLILYGMPTNYDATKLPYFEMFITNSTDSSVYDARINQCIKSEIYTNFIIGKYLLSGSSIAIEKYNTTLTGKSIIATINKPVNLSVVFKDQFGNLLNDKLIHFYVNGIYVGDATTGNDAVAKLLYVHNQLGFALWEAKFDESAGYKASNGISNIVINDNPTPQKQTTSIIMNSFKGSYNKIVILSVKLFSGGKTFSSKFVDFFVNGVWVGRNKTNSQGLAIFNYKVVKTGNLNVKSTFSEDNNYTGSSKTSILSVPNLSEIKIKNTASVKGKTVKIINTITNLGYDKGTFKLTFKLAKGLTYVKPKVSIGTISYNAKTMIATWSVSNLKVDKTKSNTIVWNLKAKKSSYSMTPNIIKNNYIQLLSNNNLSFKVK